MKILLLLIGFLFLPLGKVYAQSSVTINEVLVHPSPGGGEWIEVYNPNGIDLKSYWVDDDTNFGSDSGSSGKKSFESVQGSTGQYVVLDLSSALFNNTGDIVVLFDGSGTIVDQVQYGEDPRTDVTIGRTPNGTGNFYLLSSATKGSQNSGPKAPPTEPPPPTAKPTKVTVQEVQSVTTVARTQTNPNSVATTRSTATPIPSPTPVRVSVTPKIASVSAGKIASKSAYPSAVLGVQSVTTDKNILPKPTDKVFGQKAASISPLSLVLGLMAIAGCGILVYFKKWKGK